MTAKFPGTREERQRFERVLARNTVPASVHERYLELAEGYLWRRKRTGVSDGVQSAVLRKSRLFREREYLVAYLSEERFARVAGPHDQALCTPDMRCFSGPVVLLPLQARRARSLAFISIVEHEFVHANQALCGRFVAERRGGGAKGILEDVLDLAELEYEANLLQLGRWPMLGSPYVGRELTLTRWCLFRGWSAAIEALLCGEFCQPKQLSSVLRLLRSRLVSFFQKLNALPSDVDWFEGDFVRLVAVIADNVAKVAPGHVRSARAWLKSSRS